MVDWCCADWVFRAALGRGGVRRDKQEGDGATPAGPMPLRRVLYRADRVRAPDCAVPAEPIAPSDGWCDDVGQTDYNRMIRLPHDGHYEELWRQDGLYDVIGVLGWNDAPIQRGRGSAIFLHVARPDDWAHRGLHRAAHRRPVGRSWRRGSPRYSCCRASVMTGGGIARGLNRATGQRDSAG